MSGAKRTKIKKADLREIAGRVAINDKSPFSPKELDQLRKDELVIVISFFGHCEKCLWPCLGVTPEWDHKIPVSQQCEGDDPIWQALCKPCHDKKTREQDIPNSARCRRLRGETGQKKRRDERKAKGKPPLIQGRKEIQSRGFQKAPEGHSPWKTKSARVKQLDESYE